VIFTGQMLFLTFKAPSCYKCMHTLFLLTCHITNTPSTFDVILLFWQLTCYVNDLLMVHLLTYLLTYLFCFCKKCCIVSLLLPAIHLLRVKGPDI